MAKKEIKINGKLTEAQVKKMASKAAFEDPKVVKAEVEEIADQRLNHNRQNKWQAMKQYFEAFILLKHMGYTHGLQEGRLRLHDCTVKVQCD
jgi:gamma-glutamyl:cysteine ligase YbdK (ATP-grasp superfamily)